MGIIKRVTPTRIISFITIISTQITGVVNMTWRARRRRRRRFVMTMMIGQEIIICM
jgi:hypothetical protein